MKFQSLSREDSSEDGTATHSSILAWRIPWTEEPGGLQSMRSQSSRHKRGDSTHAHIPRCVHSFSFFLTLFNTSGCPWKSAFCLDLFIPVTSLGLSIFFIFILLWGFYLFPFWYYPSGDFQCEYLLKSSLHQSVFLHIYPCTYIYIYICKHICINMDIDVHIGVHLSLMLGLQYQHYHIFCMDSSFKQLTRLSLRIFKMYPRPFIIFLWQWKDQNPHLGSTK